MPNAFLGDNLIIPKVTTHFLLKFILNIGCHQHYHSNLLVWSTSSEEQHLPLEAFPDAHNETLPQCCKKAILALFPEYLSITEDEQVGNLVVI